MSKAGGDPMKPAEILNGASDPVGLPRRPQHNDSNLSCMLSHKKLQRHSKHHYSQLTSEDDPGTSSSRSISPDGSHDRETPADIVEFVDNITTDSEQPRHVHFRSRVRISSGFSRRRRKDLLSRQDAFISISSDSSLSGSPSSSISAPLRSRSDDEANKPGWGPLGQRVSLLAHKPRQHTRKRRQSLPREEHDAQVIPNERTPLRGSSPLTAYIEGEDAYDEEADESDQERGREIDAVFGTWPQRLANIHWWWWRLEPVVCCRCLIESDTE